MAFASSTFNTSGFTRATNSFVCTNCPRPVHPYQYSRSTTLTPSARAGASRPKSNSELTTLESTVRDCASALSQACDGRVERYVKKGGDLFAAAREAAESLEATEVRGFGVSGKVLQKRICGKWVLLYTDSEAVVKNGGSITGLGSLPGADCSRVEVILEASGKAKTIETVSVFGLINGDNTLTGRWKLSGKNGITLEVTYAEAILLGRTKLRADSKAVLNTTYCGESIRVGRSPSGDIFVFERVLPLVV